MINRDALRQAVSRLPTSARRLIGSPEAAREILAEYQASNLSWGQLAEGLYRSKQITKRVSGDQLARYVREALGETTARPAVPRETVRPPMRADRPAPPSKPKRTAPSVDPIVGEMVVAGLRQGIEAKAKAAIPSTEGAVAEPTKLDRFSTALHSAKEKANARESFGGVPDIKTAFDPEPAAEASGAPAPLVDAPAAEVGALAVGNAGAPQSGVVAPAPGEGAVVDKSAAPFANAQPADSAGAVGAQPGAGQPVAKPKVKIPTDLF